MNRDLQWRIPRTGSSSTVYVSNWNLLEKCVGFYGGRRAREPRDPRSKARTNNKLNPLMTPVPGARFSKAPETFPAR